MDELIRAALAGIPIGVFTGVTAKANMIAVQTLWRLNCLAAETAWGLAKAALENIHRERQQRLAATQTKNEDKS